MKKNRKILLTIIAVICVGLSGAIYINMRGEERQWFDSLSYEAPVEIFNDLDYEETNPNIKVYITGEVFSPGVYEVAEGSRVNDVIEMAGGATANADLGVLNLAAYVKDAEKIVVPDMSDETDKSAVSVQNENGLVNINTATLEELKTLPGVGDVTAKNIISYREKNGDFKSIDGIKNVPRIGEKTYSQLKDLITV